MRVLVIGSGMVGHKLLELAVAARAGWQIEVLGEEPRPAYDRVHLTSYFQGKSAAELALAPPGWHAEHGITVHLGERAAAIDTAAHTVTSASGRVFGWDKLVLATGSAPFVPPVPGHDARGCFVYRTLEDLDRIRAWAERARVGAVIGGGLLGLEAAAALREMGVTTHVVELGPRLMTLQVDDTGGALLRRKIEALGLHVHVGAQTQRVTTNAEGAVSGLDLAGRPALPVEMVVFSAGIRPRDELARGAGLAVGPRGGIVIDDGCVTSHPDVLAIGECALHGGRIFGLVAPGYAMARAALATLAGGVDRFTGYDMSSKLKLLGVDVASFGDAHGAAPGARTVSYLAGDVYKRLTLQDGKLAGGMLVGDAGDYGRLLALMQVGAALPPHPEDLILPARAGASAPAAAGIAAMSDAASVCSCHNVCKAAITSAIAAGSTTVGALKQCTKAGTGCGSCVPLLVELVTHALRERGETVVRHLCEHFLHSRQELFHLARLHGLRTFEALLARHGRGRGCEICKPAVASILASAWNEHILDRRHAPLQDTNDRFLANLQRDGTYSVVPRVPGGEITPDQLIALGQVAKRYALYSKITGGQRVDLFGARVEQLPEIWRELIAAGFESGHAYGKALRTVKSCVGSTWCRYGVQDSVSFAIRLENRYKGLRSPHKVKAAVSGCARECAEAQSKDFGIIATDQGYNLYVGGNGGMKPQHAQLLATDLDEDTVIRYLDRFLMFYIRTADRLQRTAGWLNNLDGGIDYLRRVVVDDALGIAAELEADMAGVVGSYRCEWKAALEDDSKLRQFRPFVNSDAPDPSIVRIRMRDQHRPATWDEKAAG